MQHPTYVALNRPLLIFGVDRWFFMATLGLSGLVFWFFGAFLLSLALFGVLFVGARTATHHDRKLPEVILASARMARVYDAAMRE